MDINKKGFGAAPSDNAAREKSFIYCPDDKKRGLFDCPAYLFRGRIDICKGGGKYTIRAAGLGLAVYYINGARVSEDVLITPVSDYDKTVWYSEYDVTDMLRDGENVIFVKLGNGFYNENFDSAWDHNKARWRSSPCLYLELLSEGEVVAEADGTWRCIPDGAIYYNQLRSGEYYDAASELHAEMPSFDDSGWGNASVRRMPQGLVLRKIFGPAIRECERLSPISVKRTPEGFVFDFGKNISGYAEITLAEGYSGEITLSYAEEINPDGSLKMNGLGIYYQSVPCQVDKLKRDGKRIKWKPIFTYHGFRYVLISGISDACEIESIEAVFVHQALERAADFECSDECLTKIYRAAVASSLSNAFYSLTDCPTREKLGWLNDAQASIGQLLYNFDLGDFLRKWVIDIADTMREDGNIAAVAPSPDWGYDFGAVTNGAIVTLPYMAYRLIGDCEIIRFALPFMERYYAYHTAHIGESFLGDWTGASNRSTPIDFIDTVYALMFSYVILEVRRALGMDEGGYKRRINEYRACIENNYFKGGIPTLTEQAALAVAIVFGFGDRAKVEELFIKSILDTDKHIALGMFGIQFFYKALYQLNMSDLWYEVITAEDAPSFKVWMVGGATTLYETFDESAATISRNHHMFSNVIEEFTTEILGIKKNGVTGEVTVCPRAPRTIEYARGFIALPERKGARVSVEWHREGNGKRITVVAEGDVKVTLLGKEVLGRAEMLLNDQA